MDLKDRTDADAVLASWLEGRAFGAITVLDVEAGRVLDSAGEDALRLVVTAPLGTDSTWAVADIHELELAVRNQALESGVAWPWYVEMRPVEDEEQEEDSQPEPDVAE